MALLPWAFARMLLLSKLGVISTTGLRARSMKQQLRSRRRVYGDSSCMHEVCQRHKVSTFQLAVRFN